MLVLEDAQKLCEHDVIEINIENIAGREKRWRQKIAVSKTDKHSPEPVVADKREVRLITKANKRRKIMQLR